MCKESATAGDVRHQLPDRAVLPGPARPAVRTPTSAGSAPAGPSLLIFMITKEKHAHRVFFFRDHAERRG